VASTQGTGLILILFTSSKALIAFSNFAVFNNLVNSFLVGILTKGFSSAFNIVNAFSIATDIKLSSEL